MKKIKILLVCALLTASVVNAAEISETKPAIKILPVDSIDIIEPEEYEVYIAVFDAKKLDGIPFSYVVLEQKTLKEKIRKENWKDIDSFLIDDFNRKNKREHVLEDKFPKYKSLSGHRNLNIEVRSKTDKSFGPFDMGKTYVSRVGFNRNKTQALVYVQHVAGPEMGVGHYVLLDKLGGKWAIAGSGIGRIF